VRHTMVTLLLQFPIISFVTMLLMIAILTTCCDGYCTSVVALVALPPHKYVSSLFATTDCRKLRISNIEWPSSSSTEIRTGYLPLTSQIPYRWVNLHVVLL
jgi:hypothetical protein